MSVVFRKTGPRSFTPESLYVYLNAPVSAIIGRLPVSEYLSMSLDDAIELADQGMISEAELRDYAKQPYGKHYSRLVVYRVGRIEVAEAPVTMKLLQSDYGFFASPNFIQLSTSGAQILDGLAGFTKESDPRCSGRA